MPADPTHTFGSAGDPLGVASVLSDFTLVQVTDGSTKNDAVVADELGEFIPDSQVIFGEKVEHVCEYECHIKTEAGSLDITSEFAAVALTAVAVKTAKGVHARITVTGHYHVGGTSVAHVANVRTITTPAFLGFGATDMCGSAIATTDVQSADWSLTLGHVDADNNNGDFLCGRSQGATIEASVEAITETPPAEPSGWAKVTSSFKKSRDSFWAGSMNCKQYLAAPVAPPIA